MRSPRPRSGGRAMACRGGPAQRRRARGGVVKEQDVQVNGARTFLASAPPAHFLLDAKQRGHQFLRCQRRLDCTLVSVIRHS